MKKILLASLLVIGSSAYAAPACTLGVSTSVAGADTSFIKVPFNSVCLANVTMTYTDDATNQKLYAGSASNKGASYYGASTLGGAVARVDKCTNNSCAGEAAAKAA